MGALKGISVFDVIKLLFNEDVSKKLILEMAFEQAKIIGWAKILSAVLGASVVGVSSIIKIPQIKKILNPKLLSGKAAVALGLSLEGISIETWDSLIHVLYNRQNNNPFVNYGESLLLGLQNAIIILLISYYRKRQDLAEVSYLSDRDQIKIALQELARPLGVMIGATVALNHLAPSSVIASLQIFKIPLSIIAKLLQIRQNHQLQSATHLSQVTVGANTLGSLIRVYTTVQDYEKLGKDPVLLVGYASSFVLNAILAGQCWYYKKDDLKDEKNKNKSD